MSNFTFKPLGRKDNIVMQEFDDETLIYDLTKNKAFSLNQTSSLVWQLCDGTKTISEISIELSRKLNTLVTEDFIWFALQQLKKDDLIENPPEFRTPFEGLARREVIQRVGFASLATLPVIASLVAPMAIHAQSVCNTGPPGGALCRCFLADAPAVGVNCGTNFALGDICNAGCTCRRTASSCPSTGPLAGTCQGSCV